MKSLPVDRVLAGVSPRNVEGIEGDPLHEERGMEGKERAAMEGNNKSLSN
jgi:hypothetical protein